MGGPGVYGFRTERIEPETLMRAYSRRALESKRLWCAWNLERIRFWIASKTMVYQLNKPWINELIGLSLETNKFMAVGRYITNLCIDIQNSRNLNFSCKNINNKIQSSKLIHKLCLLHPWGAVRFGNAARWRVLETICFLVPRTFLPALARLGLRKRWKCDCYLRRVIVNTDDREGPEFRLRPSARPPGQIEKKFYRAR